MNGRCLVAGLVVAASCLSVAAAQEPVVLPPPPPPPHTLWSFLGIPQGLNKIHGALFNRKGKFPKLEKKPPLKALADPANLASDVPVIRKAAQVKMAEDLKQQKIKAIRYLAGIGCGCYDTDGGITAALQAATDDCTEEVRLAAVQAIADSAAGGACGRCGQNCCCSEPILRRLAQLAYERDDHGCYLEPSQRVREAAIRALQICCPNPAPVVIEPEPIPGPAEPGREVLPDQPTVPEREEAPLPPVPGQEVLRPLIDPTPDPIALHGEPLGVVVYADPARNVAHIHFQQQDLAVPAGTRLMMLDPQTADTPPWGELEVLESFTGSANVRCLTPHASGYLKPGYPVALAPAPAPIESSGAVAAQVPDPAPKQAEVVEQPAPVVDAAAVVQAVEPPVPSRSMTERSSRRVQPPLPPRQLGQKVSFRSPE